MTARLPLPTLLSFALVAYTVEFDNEAERRMAHSTTRQRANASELRGPWLVSLAMYANCMRLVDECGITADELEYLACTPTNLNGMQRWGYVTVDKDGVIRATPRGCEARETWRALFEEIERRWKMRFGASTIAALREPLRAIVAKLDVELPEMLPILTHGFVNRPPRRPRPAAEPATNLPLSALLSKVLLAFALDYERDADLSLPIAANVLHVINVEGVRVRDLPRACGVSREGIAMALRFLSSHECVVTEPESPGSRVRRVRLTERGLRAKRGYATRLATVEKRWRKRFGAKTIDALCSWLEALAGRLFEGLEPYPDNWRASVPRPQTLPHYPLVLHRGGYPDGS